MSEVKYKYDLHDFVRLEPGEECSLKKHFRRGPLKEVIGFYEAADRRYKDPERFYFQHVDTLVSKSKKRSDSEKPYKKRSLEYALEQASEMWILSGEVARTRRGVKRRGRILTPHDALCKRVGNKCFFVGHGDGDPPPGMVWAFAKERRGDVFFLTQDDQGHASGTKKVRNPGEGSAEPSAESSAEPSAVRSADRMPEKVRNPSSQVVETSKDAPLTRENRISLAVEPVKTGLTVVADRKLTVGNSFDVAPTPGATTAATVTSLALTKGNPNTRNARADLDHVLALIAEGKAKGKFKPNDAGTTTVGQHLSDCGADLSDTTFYGDLSDGEFAARAMTRRTSGKEDKWVDTYPYKSELRKACLLAIVTHHDDPYLGRQSLAKIMAEAMEMLAKDGIKVPGGWYPAIKKLRAH